MREMQDDPETQTLLCRRKAMLRHHYSGGEVDPVDAEGVRLRRGTL